MTPDGSGSKPSSCPFSLPQRKTMQKSNAKLKPVEETISPARQPIADALQLIEELKQAIEENDAAQAEARQRIREAEELIEKTEESLKTVPALERRALRKTLEEAKENLQDWRDHKVELERKGGSGDHADAFGSLRYKLRAAEQHLKDERGRFLQSHPHVHGLLKRLSELRVELNQLVSDIYVTERAGGIPKSGADWERVATMIDNRPPADPALVSWIDQLLVNPGAELAE
jgi:capsule polysaccharide export protein KpsE/RkpR